MEEKVLTREEIALSILNGIIGSLSDPGQAGAIDSLFGEDHFGNRPRAVYLAFQMANLFIQERNKQD